MSADKRVRKSPRSAAKTPPPPSTGKRPWLLVWLYRLLLVGIGGSLASFLGIVAATFYPHPHPTMPLVARWLRVLPQSIAPASPSPIALPTTAVSPQVPQAVGKVSPLNAEQKKQVQGQLQQLQGQLKGMGDRTAALETKLGIQRTKEPLEARLQIISRQLQGTPAPVPSKTPAPTPAQSLSQSDKFKVTLPSDLLFQESNNILRPEASLVLEKVAGELGNYRGATILISAHTDDKGAFEDNRELSFRRATAIEQYLASVLGDQYHWVVVGYGKSRPLVENDSDGNRQRNRRIEIAIDRG